MLQYIQLRNYKHTKHLINLWNNEYHAIFPIKKNIFNDLILDDTNLNWDASFVALYDNSPVGFIFVKTWLNESGFETESDSAFISLMFVIQEMRNMGIGSDMLKLAISEIKKHENIKYLKVGNEINKIFPGLPNEFVNAPIFFMNKGFVQTEGVVDMIHVLRDDKLEEYDTNLRILVATEDDKEKVLRFCMDNNYKREGYLLSLYFEKETGREVIIFRRDKQIIAVAKINESNNKYTINLPFSKDKHIGTIDFIVTDASLTLDEKITINKATKNYLIKRGCKKIIVMATNDIKFYKEQGYSAYKYYLKFELAI